MQTVIQYMSFNGNTPGCTDDLNAGGVRDYYNALAPHLYGENSIPDAGTMGSQTQIYNYLVGDTFTKAIIVTEMGIHSGGGWNSSGGSKCTNLQSAVNQYLAPYAKVQGYMWFYLGNTSNSDWISHYEVHTQSDLDLCAGW